MWKLFSILCVLFLFGCTSASQSIDSSTGSSDIMANTTTTLLETNKGNITLSLYSDTPITTGNFVSLVNEGFYNGLTFHRYEPGFVIQGGDPNGDGTGGSSKTISLEIAKGKSNARGTIAMARSSDPNSASSQFYINLANNTFLDGSYAVFGQVSQGMDVVDSLRAGDTITKITITS